MPIAREKRCKGPKKSTLGIPFVLSSIGIPAYRHTPPFSAILCRLSRALAVAL
jgi:hypothetical protein